MLNSYSWSIARKVSQAWIQMSISLHSTFRSPFPDKPLCPYLINLNISNAFQLPLQKPWFLILKLCYERQEIPVQLVMLSVLNDRIWGGLVECLQRSNLSVPCVKDMKALVGRLVRIHSSGSLNAETQILLMKSECETFCLLTSMIDL